MNFPLLVSPIKTGVVACSILCVLNFLPQARAQSVPGPEIIKLPQLETILNKGSHDTVYVINFWATWCKPCVKELPSFDSLFVATQNKPVRVVLISLDFKSQYQTRLVPFVEKNNIKPTVLMLDEPDYDSWINKVDPNWSGSIPATVVMKPGTRHFEFFEKELTFQELDAIVKRLTH